MAFDGSVQRALGGPAVHLQVLTQLAEGAQRRPAAGGRDEGVKQLLGPEFWRRVSHGDATGGGASWEGGHLMMMSLEQQVNTKFIINIILIFKHLFLLKTESSKQFNVK